LTKVCSDSVENVENRQIWSKEETGKNEAKLEKTVKTVTAGQKYENWPTLLKSA
jgi:hypothetical protein